MRNTLKIDFCCDVLGEFAEEFIWELEGSPVPLLLLVRGKIMAPAFHFNQTDINFGSIAYGFPAKGLVELTNASDITMTFLLDFPHKEGAEGDMIMHPRESLLSPHETGKVELEFIPRASGQYQNDIVVDIAKVGKRLLSLPITAEVIVPKVRFKCQMLQCLILQNIHHSD